MECVCLFDALHIPGVLIAHRIKVNIRAKELPRTPVRYLVRIRDWTRIQIVPERHYRDARVQASLQRSQHPVE